MTVANWCGSPVPCRRRHTAVSSKWRHHIGGTTAEPVRPPSPGALATELLLEETESESSDGHTHRRVVLQPELVARGSSLVARSAGRVAGVQHLMGDRGHEGADAATLTGDEGHAANAGLVLPDYSRLG